MKECIRESRQKHFHSESCVRSTLTGHGEKAKGEILYKIMADPAVPIPGDFYDPQVTKMMAAPKFSEEQEVGKGKEPQIEVAKAKCPIVRAEQGLQKFSWLEKKEWSSCSIFKVPKNLRNVDPNAYSPQFISIGPLHRGQPHLIPTEEHKWRMLRRMLARTQRNVDFYIDAISELKDRARQCYSWRTEDDMDDGEFVLMLLLDACFIVELLLAFSQGYVALGYPRFDPIFAARGVTKWIQRDLLLLENQIPLSVVNRLFKIAAEPDRAGSSLGRLAVLFFKSAIPGYIENVDASMLGIEEDLHLLGIIRQCLVPFQWMRRKSLPRESSVTTHEEKDTRETIDPIADHRPSHQLMQHPVSTLRDSGVRFKKKISSRLTEVEFEGGVLHIPPLVIDDSISIFLNLMALEQCHPHCSDEISLYMVFLDGLIDSPRDVAYLQRRGIIDNQLGSDEAVAQLFNRFCREIVIDNVAGSNLAQLTTQLNQHLQQKWPAWKASLKREYFRHPWSTISVIAAVLVISLTFIQAFYAIIGYHRSG